MVSFKQIGSKFRIFGDMIAELRKVVWLSRREALYLTGIVLLVTVIMGLILGAFDYGFAQLVDKVFVGK